ncbi:MAG: hypothetical protein IJ299_02695 [Oscillospiraceae bacterium]|nr:hypothetical protein [Oscillospiraceae bacterium]
MKKCIKIFLIILAFIIATLSAFCMWQKENLRAVYMYLTAEEEELALASSDITEIPALSESGDAPDVQSETVPSAAGTSQYKNKNGGTFSSAKEDVSPAEECAPLLSQCRSELYACESSLISRVSGMRDEVLAQWRALSPEQRTSRKKREMIISGVSRCLSLEGEVDGKVKAIIAKYKQQAKAAGKSTAEIDALWDEYTAKKANTKAYYLNKYLK